ncbi:MAG: hypothetical protein A2Y62_02860 [Candidatus Fischerbacteria bacterium RBG_13_37_8]|uniref:Uncharacterized protein n=1 Tax=Candidatus Fischerbacteria bacterium RBG_13_37_8 TaxID=1817863 RepID=A0A1F5VY58_9BACT|nr:MAG: hypothetical protein A2Y62_02860 [Candidatus Fischerbacteria bacterium RBG_13_37_8]
MGKAFVGFNEFIGFVGFIEFNGFVGLRENDAGDIVYYNNRDGGVSAGGIWGSVAGCGVINRNRGGGDDGDSGGIVYAGEGEWCYESACAVYDTGGGDAGSSDNAGYAVTAGGSEECIAAECSDVGDGEGAVFEYYYKMD